MYPNDDSIFNNNPLYGIDMAKVINKINNRVYETNINLLLQKDDSDYKYKLNKLKFQIDIALESGNEPLFMKLSKQYNMMLSEL
jgi:hypothetical protein